MSEYWTIKSLLFKWSRYSGSQCLGTLFFVQICAQVVTDLQPSDLELQNRKMILQSLTSYIQLFFPTARLNLYGSSCNGFAIADSDMVS